MMEDRNSFSQSTQNTDLGNYRRITNILILLFFLSGMCALIYEVVWEKMLVLVFGISTYSTTVILASFMGGLVLGSYIFGKFIDRVKQPLRIYGLLEIGIGLFAMATPWILAKLIDLYVWISQHLHTGITATNLIRFILSFIVLLIPTSLMGGTMPVVTKFFVHKLARMGSRVGLIYGSNVLGSVIGCFLAGFVLISTFGKHQTIYYTAFVNTAIGLITLFLNKYRNEFQNVELLYQITQPSKNSYPPAMSKNIAGLKNGKQDHPGVLGTASFSPSLLNIILITAGISGFCALAYEVLWTRTLVMFLRTSIYAFPTMLTTFLCGMAIGSLVLSKFIDHPKNGLLILAIIQGLIGIIALFTIYEFSTINEHITSIWNKHGQGWYACIKAGFVASGFIMFLPAMFFGLSFPLVSKLYTPYLKILGTSVGSCYSVNSLGSILGSMIAGFLLIPLIGITRGIIILAGLNILLCAVLLFYNPFIKRKVKTGINTVVFVTLVFLLVIIPWGQPLGSYSFNYEHVKRGGRILFYKEGVGGTVSVTQEIPHLYTSDMNKRIEVNGISVAGDEHMLRTTQKFQGHIPLLLYEILTGKSPEYVFILGLGTGESSNCILKHDIKRLDCAELVETEIEAVEHFNQINDTVLQNPRFNLIINDARNVLLTSSTTYDVIESDAVHPNIAFNTYTREYYQLCKDRLSEKGIISTWIPLFHLTPDNLKILLHTIHSVFPHVSIWFTTNFNNKHAILIGSKQVISIDVGKFFEAMSMPNIKQSLATVDLDDLESIITSFVADETTIAPHVRDVPVNTDDNLILSYSIPKTSIGEETVSANLRFFNSLGTPDLNSHFENIPDTGNIKQNIKDYFTARKYIYDGLGHYFDRAPDAAIKSYLKALEKNPQNNDIHYLINTAQFYLYYDHLNMLYNRKDFSQALQVLNELMLLKPDNMWVNNYLGVIHLEIGEIQHAITYLERAEKIAPDYYLPHYHLAIGYVRNKKPFEAGLEVRKALSLNPPEEPKKMLLELQKSLY